MAKTKKSQPKKAAARKPKGKQPAAKQVKQSSSKKGRKGSKKITGPKTPGRSAARVAVQSRPTVRRPAARTNQSEAGTPSNDSGAGQATSEFSVYAGGRDTLRLIYKSNLGSIATTSVPQPTDGVFVVTSISDLTSRVESKEKLLAQEKPALEAAAGGNGPDIKTLLQTLLWVAEGIRLPRAAFVGRALYDLGATDENLSKSCGTALKICKHIEFKNKRHLRPKILKALKTLDSAGDPKIRNTAFGSLNHALNKALATLQRMDVLQAAAEGVYLVGLGLQIFKDFPIWSTPDEEPPKSPQRPSKRTRLTPPSVTDTSSPGPSPTC